MVKKFFGRFLSRLKLFLSLHEFKVRSNFSIFILDKAELPLVLASAMNVINRNAGPKSQLQSKKGQDQRNVVIDDIVNFVSFGDKESEFS